MKRNTCTTWLELAWRARRSDVSHATPVVHLFDSEQHSFCAIEFEGRILLSGDGRRSLFESLDAAAHFLRRLGVLDFALVRHVNGHGLPRGAHAQLFVLRKQGLRPAGEDQHQRITQTALSGALWAATAASLHPAQ
ncbi:MAG: hypothetical protein JNJ60_20580 [Rhodocyclaceae bacterium]|nr:hypothetical protein [Rhodocyclaceae bacterium]